MRMLCLFFSVFGEFQAPPISLECELQRFESFSVDLCGHKYSRNDVKTDRGKKRLFWYMWTRPTSQNMLGSAWTTPSPLKSSAATRTTNPEVTSHLKALLNEKKRTFRSGN